MGAYSNLVRLPLVDAKPLTERVEQLCDVYFAAGYRLSAMTGVGTDLLLVFQKTYTFAGTN
jgi:hypothetical protein